jgi:hypothetical protein
MNKPDQTKQGKLDNPLLAEHADVIHSLGKRVITDVIEIGRRLTKAKELVGHGNWLPWLDREFGWKATESGTCTTAQRFMQVYELGKSTNLVDLEIPVSGLYLLAAPSTPSEARDEIIDRAEGVEKVSFAEAKAVVTRAKAAIKSRKPARQTPGMPSEEQKASDKTAERQLSAMLREREGKKVLQGAPVPDPISGEAAPSMAPQEPQAGEAATISEADPDEPGGAAPEPVGDEPFDILCDVRNPRERDRILDHLGKALDHIAELPAAEDVVRVIRARRLRKIDQEIRRAATWLKALALGLTLPDTPSELAKLINDNLDAIAKSVGKTLHRLRDLYREVLRNADKRQRVTEVLALISALDLTLSDLDVTTNCRRNPATSADADAEAGAGSAPAAGETKHLN